MQYIVEVNNATGAFQIVLFETQSAALSFISNINSGTSGLKAYNRGTCSK